MPGAIMASSINLSSSTFFPSLSSSSINMGSYSAPLFSSVINPILSLPKSCDWKSLLYNHNSSAKDLNLSFIPCPKKEVSFSKEELNIDHHEWDLSLISHVIAKRPFYSSLLPIIKKTWLLKVASTCYK